MKKTISWILTSAMIFLLFPVGIQARAVDFSDMPAKGYWSYSALNDAVSNGLLKGSDDGTIRPTASVTRAEAAAIINRAFGATEKDKISFSDVTSDQWYYEDVEKAVHMKTFNGTDDSHFSGNTKITREQAFAVIARAIGLSDGTSADLSSYKDTSKVSSWAVGSMAAMVKAGYVSGSNDCLNPSDSITREQFAQVMSNVIKQYISEAGTYTTVSKGNVIVRGGNVVLKDLTVDGDLIIGDGVGTSDVTINNVSVNGRIVLRGAGANSFKVLGKSKASNVTVALATDGGIHINVSSDADVDVVYVNDNSNEVILEGTIGTVSVASEGTKVSLKNADITTVNVAAAKSSVNVESGKVGSVIVDSKASNTSVKVSGSSDSTSIGTITTESTNTAIAVEKGSVSTIVAKDASSGTKITTGENGKVSLVAAASKANVTITNSGSVGKVVAESGASVSAVTSTGATDTSVKTITGTITENTSKGTITVKSNDGSVNTTVSKTGSTSSSTTTTTSGGSSGGSSSTTYYLNYDATTNGFGAPSTQSSSSNSFTVSSTVPTKKDNIFVGWKAPNSTTIYQAGDTVEGCTLTAVWKTINDILNEGITAVSNVSGFNYANLSLNTATNTVTVTINDGNKHVDRVYTDIADTLVEELNKYSIGVDSVSTGNTNSTGDTKITIDGSDITNEQFYTFVRDGGLTNADKAIIGDDAIDCLAGQSITIDVTPTNGTAVKYTVQFRNNDGTMMDTTSLNNKMSGYADANYIPNTSTLTININDGTKSATDVYGDIWGTLSTSLSSGNDSDFIAVSGSTLNTPCSTPYAISTETDTLEAIKNMIKGGSFYPVSGNEQDFSISSGKIYEFAGYETKIFLLDSNKDPIGIYTVVFKEDMDSIISEGVEAVNSVNGFDYAKLFLNKDTNTVTVAIKDSTKTVNSVYTDIVSTLVNKLNENANFVKNISTGSDNILKITGNPADLTDVKTFVENSGLIGANGDTISGTDTISCLNNKSFDIAIEDVFGQTTTYKIEFI